VDSLVFMGLSILLLFLLAMQYFDSCQTVWFRHALTKSAIAGVSWIWLHVSMTHYLFRMGLWLKELSVADVDVTSGVSSHMDPTIAKAFSSALGIVSLVVTMIRMSNSLPDTSVSLVDTVFASELRTVFTLIFRILISIIQIVVGYLGIEVPINLLLLQCALTLLTSVIDVLNDIHAIAIERKEYEARERHKSDKTSGAVIKSLRQFPRQWSNLNLVNKETLLELNMSEAVKDGEDPFCSDDRNDSKSDPTNNNATNRSNIPSDKSLHHAEADRAADLERVQAQFGQFISRKQNTITSLIRTPSQKFVLSGNKISALTRSPSGNFYASDLPSPSGDDGESFSSKGSVNVMIPALRFARNSSNSLPRRVEAGAASANFANTDDANNPNLNSKSRSGKLSPTDRLYKTEDHNVIEHLREDDEDEDFSARPANSLGTSAAAVPGSASVEVIGLDEAVVVSSELLSVEDTFKITTARERFVENADYKYPKQNPNEEDNNFDLVSEFNILTIPATARKQSGKQSGKLSSKQSGRLLLDGLTSARAGGPSTARGGSTTARGTFSNAAVSMAPKNGGMGTLGMVAVRSPSKSARYRGGGGGGAGGVRAAVGNDFSSGLNSSRALNSSRRIPNSSRVVPIDTAIGASISASGEEVVDNSVHDVKLLKIELNVPPGHAIGEIVINSTRPASPSASPGTKRFKSVKFDQELPAVNDSGNNSDMLNE
jgi:hypothetical protein